MELPPVVVDPEDDPDYLPPGTVVRLGLHPGYLEVSHYAGGCAPPEVIRGEMLCSGFRYSGRRRCWWGPAVALPARYRSLPVGPMVPGGRPVKKEKVPKVSVPSPPPRRLPHLWEMLRRLVQHERAEPRHSHVGESGRVCQRCDDFDLAEAKVESRRRNHPGILDSSPPAEGGTHE